jgi:hypothetical protein
VDWVLKRGSKDGLRERRWTTPVKLNFWYRERERGRDGRKGRGIPKGSDDGDAREIDEGVNLGRRSGFLNV